jgi:hypothetical protein
MPLRGTYTQISSVGGSGVPPYELVWVATGLNAEFFPLYPCKTKDFLVGYLSRKHFLGNIGLIWKAIGVA